MTVSRIKFTACLNIDDLVPYQKAQYSLMTGTLSDVGYDIFWAQLNDLMRKLDLNINDVKVTQCTISTTYTQPASEILDPSINVRLEIPEQQTTTT